MEIGEESETNNKELGELKTYIHDLDKLFDVRKGIPKR